MTADRPTTEPHTDAPQDNPDWDAGFIEGYKRGRAEAEAAQGAAPLPYTGINQGTASGEFPPYKPKGAAPRAEGLDEERLAAVLWCNDVMEEGFGAGRSWDYWTDTVFPVGAEVQDIYRSRAEQIAAEYLASRPSDERVDD